jgi:CARDB protein
MAFSDDEPPYAPPRAPARRGPGDRQRQIMARRAMAAGAGVVILILIVLGVRGCLDARKTRSFENFNADLRSLVSQTNTLSKSFFGQLTNPSSNRLEFQTQLKTDAGTAAQLAARADALSTPGELGAAHADLDLAYELRANALTGIADELAGGKANQATTNHVVAQMKQLIASDVIYGRAQSEIDQGFKNNGIDETAPPSQFVPDPQEKWITPSTIDGILSGVGVSSGGGGSVSGVHGTGIAGATLGGSALTPDTPITVASVPPNTLAITIQNQGQSTEQNVKVSVKVSGGGANTSKEATVSSIAAGATGTANVALGSVPTGSALTIEAKVAPVLGEHVTTNNNATYNVTFQ